MKQSLVGSIILFRFFGKLKKEQPKLFYFCLILTVLQLLCTAVKLEVTPFMLYGMFSEKYTPAATFSKYQILIDGQKLPALNLPFREKMYLQATAENYLFQWQNKGVDPLQIRVESKYPFFTAASFYPYVAPYIYNKPSSLIHYEHWFKRKAARSLGKAAHQVTILREVYSIRPYSAPIKLVHVDTLRGF